MNINDAKKEYIEKTKFDIGEISGIENLKGQYIVLREPTEDELVDAPKDDEKKITNYLLNNVLPACLIEHSFEDDEQKPANKKAVIELLKTSSKKTTIILRDWMDKHFFQEKAGEESVEK